MSQDDTARRRRLQAEILRLHSRDQRRISNQLHDGVSQNLAGITLLVENLAQQLAGSSTGLVDQARQIGDLVAETGRQAEDRTLLGEFTQRPAASGLLPALDDLASRCATLFEVDATVGGQAPPHLDATTAAHLFRIAEEAAYNALRHSSVQQLRFEVGLAQDQGWLTIADDGGRLNDYGSGDPQARGMRLMALRCERIGASLEVASSDQAIGNTSGTRVTCRWPVGPKSDQQ